MAVVALKPRRQYSFTDHAVANPAEPPPGDRLDGEVDRINQAIAELIDWVSVSLNTDGTLKTPPKAAPAATAVAARPPLAGAFSMAGADPNALAMDWAEVSFEWAEHMPDTIPPNILATMGITGDHWSSRWWANRVAQLFQNSGQALVNVSDTAPTPPYLGQLWWDSTSGQMYVYFDDGTSRQWVAALNAPGPVGPQGPPGSGNIAGMVAGQIPIAAAASTISASANLSGDVTSNSALAVTLATVNANVGVFQGLTVDAKGRVTAASNQGYATVAAMNAADALAAPIASPVFTGDPRAPTPATADNDTSLATTAYVQAQGYATSASVTTADNLRVAKAGDTMAGDLAVPNVRPTGAAGAAVLFNVTGAGADQKKWQVHAVPTQFAISAVNDVEGAENVFLTAVRGTGTAITKVMHLAITEIGSAAGPSDPLRVISASGAYCRVLYQGNRTWSQGVSSAGAWALADETGAALRLGIDTAGACTNTTGTWAAISDASVKIADSITPYERGLDAILALEPVNFTYNGKGGLTGEHFGLVADQVLPHVPEIIGEIDLAAGPNSESLVVKTVDPGRLIYALINAVKELSARVEALEGGSA